MKASLGMHDAALEDFDEAISLDPSFADAYTNRGQAKFDLGMHEEAVADHGEAIRLRPDFAEAYFNKALARIKLGQTSEAAADLEAAREHAAYPELLKAIDEAEAHIKGSAGSQ